MRRYRATFSQAMVHAHVAALWRAPAQHRAGLWQEAGRHIFGRQAHFDGVTIQLYVVLRQSQRFARGHAQLPFHKVDPGDGLGHGVFHLQPGIHFHEVELSVAVEQKLHRAGPDVTDGAGRAHRRLANACAQRGIHGGRGRFFNDFLVPALYRAVAFAQVNHVSMAVGQHLNFDVARRHHGALQDQLAVAKGHLGLRARRGQCLRQQGLVVYQSHAAPATAGGSLHHDWKADVCRGGQQSRVALIVALIARYAGHSGRQHQPLGLRLVAHGADGGPRRADEHESGRVHRIGEVCVLGQKAIARVHCVRPGARCGLDQGGDVQVGIVRRGPTDAHGLVGGEHVGRAAVSLRVNSHRAIPQETRGTHDADGDLAAVGDQHGVKGSDLLLRCHGSAPVSGARHRR